MIIRHETPADAAAISSLVTAAFLTMPYADGTEAAIVERLREAGGFHLSLVADEGGAVIGHVAASAATLDGVAGWSGIGPLAALPGWQGRGVGSALMTAALRLLAPQGHRGVVLVGDPAYYARFGLVACPGLTCTGVSADNVLGLPFAPHPAPRGAIGFHPAFGL